MPIQVPVREINAARRLTDFLSRAYDQYAPPLVKESVKYFNDNPDPIPGFAGDNLVKALMPAVGWRNPRVRELYKRILGFEPVGKVKIAREQFEGPVEFTKTPSLVSHKSRGGIFVQPTEAKGSYSPASVSARATNPQDFAGVMRLPLPLQGEVDVTNPIIVPMIDKFNNLVREIPLSSFGKKVATSNPQTVQKKQLEKRLAAELIRSLGVRKLAAGNLERELTLPDTLRAKLAHQSGFDAVIPLALNRAFAARKYREVPEMMLLPSEIVERKYSTRPFIPNLENLK